MPTKLAPLGKRRKKFTRATVGKNSADEAGAVRVSIILLNPKTGQHLRGNMTRHFHIQNVRVSEVARSIEAWLFHGDARAKPLHVDLH